MLGLTLIVLHSAYSLAVDPQPPKNPSSRGDGETLDAFPPKILWTSPANGETSVYPNADIVIRFNESMNTSSFSCEFISGLNPGMTWTWESTLHENDTIRGSHADLFASPSEYVFNVTYAEDLSGNALAPGSVPNPWNWSTIVVITSTDPAHRETNVPLDSDIVINFSAPTYPWEVNIVIQPFTSGWSITMSGDGRSIILSGPLWTCTAHIFEVIQIIQIAKRFPSLVPNPWTFVTACPPEIISTDPFDGQSNVALGKVIEVEFSRAMDRGTINWTISPDPGGWSRSWSLGDKLLTLSHAGYFEPNTTYTMTVTGLDNERNPLIPGPVPNPWNWTTEDVPKPLAPPSNLVAFLSGSLLENVTLTWNLSYDDKPGGNVSHYDIYRGVDFYDSVGTGYPLWASVPSGVFQYVDQLAGQDTHCYYYLVCADGPVGGPSCSSNQAGKFTRPVAKGPNLVSIPLVQSNESIGYVLQTVEYDKAWHYYSISQEWKWYMKQKTYKGDLWQVNHTMGLWVNVTQDSNLTVAGVVPAQTTIHLQKGWNLLSFPSFNSSYTVADLEAEIGATRVEGYDPVSPYHLRVLGDGEMLQAGHGYWVKVQVDADWIVEVS